MSLQEIGLFPLIAGASAFALVLAMWGMGLILYGRRKVAQEEAVRARLRGSETVTAGARTLRVFHEGDEQTILVPGQSRGPGLWARLEERRVAAHLAMPLERLLLLVLMGSAAVALAMFAYTGQWFAALLCAAGVPFGTFIYTNMRMGKRATVFDRQLIDALDLATRALRAGHPLSGSFQLVAEEIPAPVGTLFGEMCQQQELGLPMDDALRQAALKSRSDDMRLLSATLSINIRTGGNLADVMGGLAKVIRERNRLGRRFKSMFAQTQMSKQILMGMPFAALLGLQLIGPEYMDPLYSTTAGNLLLVGAGVMLFLGWLTMNYMVRIKI